MGSWQLFAAYRGGLFLHLLANDVITEFNTFVTNEDRGARNQFAYLMLALATKGTVQQFAVFARTVLVFTHLPLPLFRISDAISGLE
jgi:hypothetical protein